jgi:tetratricopeptide (TPR) repeat protein
MVEAGEVERVRDRHRDFYQLLAQRAEREVMGPEQKAWLDLLELEHDNYRAALEWSMADTKSAEAATRLAGSLWWFWEVRGYWTEARRWLKAALARPEGVSAAARAKALNAASGIALRLYDMAESKALAQESLELSRQLGDKRTTASCLVILGIDACRIQDYKQAEQLGGESLSLSREAGDNWGAAWALGILGLVAHQERDLPKARALMEESIQGMRAMGHPWGTTIMLVNLGIVAREQGDLAGAVAIFEEALTEFRQLGDKSYVSYTQLNLGTVASALGEHARAARFYADSLALRKELEDRRGMATCVAALACTTAGLGDFERAARLFGAAEAMRERLGGSVPALIRAEHDARVAETRRALGEDRFKTAWDAGRAMPAEQAIEFALASVPEGAARGS